MCIGVWGFLDPIMCIGVGRFESFRFGGASGQGFSARLKFSLATARKPPTPKKTYTALAKPSYTNTLQDVEAPQSTEHARCHLPFPQAGSRFQRREHLPRLFEFLGLEGFRGL